MPIEDSFVRLSADNIIELIKDHRTDIIDKLLRDPDLNLYLKETFDIEKVSEVKREFIKRTLRELNLSSIDLTHYAQIILEIRKSGAFIISTTGEKLFHQEIYNSIRSYLL